MYVQEGFFHETDESFHEKMVKEYDAFYDYLNEVDSPQWVIAQGLGAFNNWPDYVTTHYAKAKLMIYALHRLMGDEAFWQTIVQYYQEHSFRIAGGSDFMAVASAQYGECLADFFDEWLHSGGLPLLPPLSPIG
jgi:hypothetical protein